MARREKLILEGEDRASPALDKAESGVKRLDDTLKKVALQGGGLMLGAMFVKLGGQAIQSAVDAEEAGSAFNTTFGPAAERAGRFVEGLANKAGMANYQMQQMMAITGNVVQGIGATATESEALSERMLTLAADVASFSNAEGGAEAVMLALQSAINGEREALKTYGLALSETEVQQKAFEMTGKASVDELTRMDKALATVELAYQKAGHAVGDLDRTQDSAANTMRRIAAGVEEFKVSLGQALLPVVEAVLPALEGLAGIFAKLPQLATAAGGAMAGFMLGGPIGALVGGVTGLGLSMAGVGTQGIDRIQAIDEAMRALPAAVMAGGESLNSLRGVLADLDVDAGAIIGRVDTELPAAMASTGTAIEALVNNTFPGWVAAQAEIDAALAQTANISVPNMATALATANAEMQIDLQGIGDGIEEAAERWDDSVEAMGESFGDLPGLIEDHEGDVQAALDHILELQQARINFQRNINTLAEAGLDQLVTLLSESPDSAAVQAAAEQLASEAGLAMARGWEAQADANQAAMFAAVTPTDRTVSAAALAFMQFGVALNAAVSRGYGVPVLPAPLLATAGGTQGTTTPSGSITHQTGGFTQYQHGGYVAETGLAFLHRGERVQTREEAASTTRTASTTVQATVNLTMPVQWPVNPAEARRIARTIQAALDDLEPGKVHQWQTSS